MGLICKKRKQLILVYICNKYSETFNEKKMVKKFSLPKQFEANKVLYVEECSFLVFYGNSPQFTIFDLRKECFLKSGGLAKPDSTRQANLTSISLSQQHQMLMIGDELGDLQIWVASTRGLEFKCCCNISSKCILNCCFLMNNFKNETSDGVCLGLDNQLYLIEFKETEKEGTKMILANKFDLGTTDDISLKELDMQVQDAPEIKSAFSEKLFQVKSMTAVRSAEGKIITTMSNQLFKISEDLPIHDHVFFPKFDFKNVIASYRIEKHVFEAPSDVIFCSRYAIHLFNCCNLQMKSIFDFAQILSEFQVQSIKRLKVQRIQKLVIASCILNCDVKANYFVAVAFDKNCKVLAKLIKEKVRDYGLDKSNKQLVLLGDNLREIELHQFNFSEPTEESEKTIMSTDLVKTIHVRSG